MANLQGNYQVLTLDQLLPVAFKFPPQLLTLFYPDLPII